MKQLFFRHILLAVIGVGVIACKKENNLPDPSPPPPPPSPPATYTIKADTSGTLSFGTVVPVSATVTSGGSITIHAYPKAGCRTASVTVNGVAAVTADSVVLNNITSNVTVRFNLTDALTEAQFVAMKAALIGWWDFTTADSVRKSEQLIRLEMLGGDSSQDRTWKATRSSGIAPNDPFADCEYDMYFEFRSDSVFQRAGSHPCVGTSAGSLYGAWAWSLSSNGKEITLKDNGGLSYIDLLNFTSSRVDIFNPKLLYGNGYIRKYTLVRR